MSYIPDIEDLRIGYRLEYSPIEGVWEKALIKKETDMTYLLSRPIRTSYLTKEQIESRGWQSRLGDTYKVTLFRKNEYTLGYDWDTHSMKISTFGETPYNLYFGDCKSINEFDTLIKWLKI